MADHLALVRLPQPSSAAQHNQHYSLLSNVPNEIVILIASFTGLSTMSALRLTCNCIASCLDESFCVFFAEQVIDFTLHGLVKFLDNFPTTFAKAVEKVHLIARIYDHLEHSQLLEHPDSDPDQLAKVGESKKNHELAKDSEVLEVLLAACLAKLYSLQAIELIDTASYWHEVPHSFAIDSVPFSSWTFNKVAKALVASNIQLHKLSVNDLRWEWRYPLEIASLHGTNDLGALANLQELTFMSCTQYQTLHPDGFQRLFNILNCAPNLKVLTLDSCFDISKPAFLSLASNVYIPQLAELNLRNMKVDVCHLTALLFRHSHSLRKLIFHDCLCRTFADGCSERWGGPLGITCSCWKEVLENLELDLDPGYPKFTRLWRYDDGENRADAVACSVISWSEV